ncbi:MAG: RNA polymerase sigma-70 factor [Tannerellaceae bacterium]|nr:RNA polymerase sigma-70 factor [Tannerellaceae bacterium]
MNTNKIDIEQLLLSVAGDSRGAFDLFYHLYYEQVFRFAYYFLQDKESCREVVVNVFFSLWQSRIKLKDIINLETYLYVITRNESHRYLKKKSFSSTVSLQEVPLAVEKSTVNSPEDQIVTKELMAILKQAIHNLPEKCRIIFLMAREEGLKPKQIADILSIKESTVRVQMKIAIEKLVEEIKKHYPDITLTLLLNYLLSL